MPAPLYFIEEKPKFSARPGLIYLTGSWFRVAMEPRILVHIVSEGNRVLPAALSITDADEPQMLKQSRDH